MKKKKASNDYSHFTLADVIKRKIRRKSSFSALSEFEKREVLEYIERHRIPIKALDNKVYDVLKQKFFVTEYSLPCDMFGRIVKGEKEFESFDDFYAYTSGDIYDYSCFFGYVFSEEEIKRYSLDARKLNFDSLIDYDIDDFSFESLQNERVTRRNSYRAKEVFDWVLDCEPCATLKELEIRLKQFRSKFDSFSYDYAFFSLIVQKDPERVKQAAIEYACQYPLNSCFGFGDVLLTYGQEAALYFINHFSSQGSDKNRKKYMLEFENSLEGYCSGACRKRREMGFDSRNGFYYCREVYSDGVHLPLVQRQFFLYLDDLASYTSGDLRGANLFDAPIEKEEVRKYLIDDETILPPRDAFETYVLEKKWTGSTFLVSQKWLDKDQSVIHSTEHTFSWFFDLVHFVKGDLSGLGLITCEGLENIKSIPGLKLDGLRVRSETAEKLGLPLKPLAKELMLPQSFETSETLEHSTSQAYLAFRQEEEEAQVSYISDIHLMHRCAANHCKSEDDFVYVIRKIGEVLREQSTQINLIGGDTTSEFVAFQMLVQSLSESSSSSEFFFTLGNHELWNANGCPFETIVQQYRNVLRVFGQKRMHLVQNNLFYEDGKWIEITEEELSNLTEEELRQRTKEARIIIFGGMGFAGRNENFNANNGIYETVIDRQREILESEKLRVLYEKVTHALVGRNLIVLTHMPLRDWAGPDAHTKDGVVYVNGHNHRNYYYDDGKKRIYADNQVGYRGKKLSFKRIYIPLGYNWFDDYEDGIFEIAKLDYEKFYRGFGEWITFNRKYPKLYLIKREGAYMFLVRNDKGNLLILNGGAIKKAGDHTLEYFYEHLANYAKSVRLFLSDYDRKQKYISSEVKRFGGDGRIHGCIVDIDFLNHLFIKPFDDSITSYYATSMTSKEVYENLPSLLKYRRPDLYENYVKLLGKPDQSGELTLYAANLPVTAKTRFDSDTFIYRLSRGVKGLQYTAKYNVVRLWNDATVVDATAGNGRLIVSSIFDPDRAIEPIQKIGPNSALSAVDHKGMDASKSAVQCADPKDTRSYLTEGKKRWQYEVFNEKIQKETCGDIVCTAFRGSISDADFKCNKCGHIWSAKPYELGEGSGYCCPKCGAGKKE